MFDEAKKSFNELSNAHHLNILNDRNYFYIDEDDLRHALKVNEIVAIGDYDVQNDINIDLVNWVKTIKHEIEHINKHDPKDFRDISRCCDDLIKLINRPDVVLSDFLFNIFNSLNLPDTSQMYSRDEVDRLEHDAYQGGYDDGYLEGMNEN